ERDACQGAVDVVKMKATLYTDGKPREGDIPGDIADQAREYREKLVEAAAETDDELLSKYLESGSLEEPEMLKALRAGITTGKIIRGLGPAAVKGVGTQAPLDLIDHELRSPAARGAVAGTDLK